MEVLVKLLKSDLLSTLGKNEIIKKCKRSEIINNLETISTLDLSQEAEKQSWRSYLKDLLKSWLD